MPVHLRKEIDKLKKKILSLGAMVEKSVADALTAISDKDETLAKQVIEEDVEVDRLEVEIEEDCLKILALHQPVAIDLRFIVAVLKINNDLERIADLAVNIAERVEIMTGKKMIQTAARYPEMIEKTMTMLRNSIKALVEMDASLAREILLMDDDVDDINREIFDWATESIQQAPKNCALLIIHMSLSRYLERIADSATNIAEDVIYMIEGDIVRHADKLDTGDK